MSSRVLLKLLGLKVGPLNTMEFLRDAIVGEEVVPQAISYRSSILVRSGDSHCILVEVVGNDQNVFDIVGTWLH